MPSLPRFIVLWTSVLVALALPLRSPAYDRDPVIAAAGDIACDQRPGAAKDEDDGPSGCKMEQTAALVRATQPDAVLTLGDEQYPAGTLAQFESGYAKNWGAFRNITRPAPGNHEYESGANGYYAYFGARAGDRATRGNYSYDLGGWHLIALNGNCAVIGGCAAGSPQERWLKTDLARHHAACTLAYWHQPRFSSGLHHSDPQFRALWDDLYSAGADVVLAGHDHSYERFAPQTPAGVLDPVRGLTEFVVGTGGKSHYAFKATEANSVVRDASHFGILVMTLARSGYAFRFVSAPRGQVLDAGSGACHHAK